MQLIIKQQAYTIDGLLKAHVKEPWIQEIQQFLSVWVDDHSSITVSTSGSTGTPKPITLDKHAVLKSAGITVDYFQLTKDHRALLCLPARYIAGKLMIIRAMVADMDLICIPPRAQLDLDMTGPITFAAMTPMQVDYLLSKDGAPLSTIETLIIGGGATSGALQQQLQSISTACYQTYGMTETITHVALQRLNGGSRQETFEVLDGFTIDQDDRGCLRISADHIYDGLVTTNDIVELIDSTHFKWLGRADNVINSGGAKVHPESVEKTIAELIHTPFFIFGRADDQLGSAVALAMEGAAMSDSEQTELLKKIHSQVKNPEKPRSIHFLECFLYTETGKIKRTATLKQYEI